MSSNRSLTPTEGVSLSLFTFGVAGVIGLLLFFALRGSQFSLVTSPEEGAAVKLCGIGVEKLYKFAQKSPLLGFTTPMRKSIFHEIKNDWKGMLLDRARFDCFFFFSLSAAVCFVLNIFVTPFD